MVMERGADGCLSFEDFNSIVSVLSAFSGSLFSVIQSSVSEMEVWRAFLVSSKCSGLHDLRSRVSSAKNWCGQEWLNGICESGCVYNTKRIGPSTDPCGAP